MEQRENPVREKEGLETTKKMGQDKESLGQNSTRPAMQSGYEKKRMDGEEGLGENKVEVHDGGKAEKNAQIISKMKPKPTSSKAQPTIKAADPKEGKRAPVVPQGAKIPWAKKKPSEKRIGEAKKVSTKPKETKFVVG